SSKFSVEINAEKTIDDLKKAIKKEKPNDLNNIDADKLALSCVAIPSSPIRTIKLNNLAENDTKIMQPILLDESDDLISEKFDATPPRKTIHIIVQRPST
ncbi:hypothetical protein BGZ76_006557, partial [Entomortierella beljakovae]